MNNIKLLNSISIGTDPGGNPITINAYEYSNGVSGPTLYLQGGVHGGEVTLWVLKQLVTKLQNYKIKGNIVIIPIANPVAWGQRTYFSTNGKFDFYMGKDWNRSYPGNMDGTLSQRISSVGF
ncbi:succinylglutamate desuccinylase/aspartoacylase family protein, partial [Candidatus Dojkabacteria bacterium]|nr:succinylglutamate desuccinylase/aspartoacylase family protein [Candidatus Dojkabacteria bacterium]